MNDNFFKWLTEEKEKHKTAKNLYVLVGPPAVGKTSWIRNNIENKNVPFTVISRDQIIEDEIFLKYKLSNNELYTLNPPADAEVGKVIPSMEKYGPVIARSSGKKAFSQIARANAEIESLISKEKDSVIRIVNGLEKDQPYNVVIDAINATPQEREKVLSMFQGRDDVKKVAVFFKFKEYRAEIEKRAEKRAKELGKELGSEFTKGRQIPSGVFDAIFSRIEKPTKSEGFDEVIMVDSFKDKKLEPWEELTAETLTRNFRDYLNEEEERQETEEILEEAKLSKIWRKRARQRALRHERQYPNAIDRKWAHEQQAKWNKNPELEEEYLKELEHAKALTDSTKNYLEKIRSIRKQKMEAKKNSIGVVPLGPGKKAKGSISVAMKPEHGGIRKGLEKNIAKLKKKSKEAVGIPMAASYGVREEQNIPLEEEKGDGNND